MHPFSEQLLGLLRFVVCCLLDKVKSISPREEVADTCHVTSAINRSEGEAASAARQPSSTAVDVPLLQGLLHELLLTRPFQVERHAFVANLQSLS